LHFHYNPYEAGDRAHDIERSTPVELKPKYASDDYNNGQRYSPSSYRPVRARLETDREAMMRPSGQRQHKFNDDVVYIDTIPKHRDGTRGQVRNAWADREEEENNNDDFFHLNPSDVNNNRTKRNDYRDEYMMAKRSVASTKNIISSIHNELQNIVSEPSSDNYHA
jgi:hypothetical protein